MVEGNQQKFNIQNIECHIAKPATTSTTMPCMTYVECTFSKPQDIGLLSHMAFQNYYTYSITIKQFVSPTQSTNPSRDEMKNEANWVAILKNYKLMNNAHYEGDAQNWHIIGLELFNCKLNLKNLRNLRIYCN